MYRQGAIGALLDIYEQAISDFKKVIADIPAEALNIITDPQTSDDNCRSLQTILTHVVHAGYGYATFIHNLKGNNQVRPPKIFKNDVSEYLTNLSDVFAFTETVLKDFSEAEIQPSANAPKIHTTWEQVFDTEQMMEHAIVHILRHRRQIERIKLKQFNKA